MVVDKKGTIVVVDTDNQRLRRMTGRHVTTLAGGSEAGTEDGAGAGARFKEPYRLALDERGRLLVAEIGRADKLRVVEASLAPPPWMGPVEEKNEPPQAFGNPVLEDYAKLADDGDLADVVFVVEGQRFPAYRGVLAARTEYFRGLFKSAGLRHQGGVLRGRECPCVPCAAAVPVCRRGGWIPGGKEAVGQVGPGGVVGREDVGVRGEGWREKVRGRQQRGAKGAKTRRRTKRKKRPRGRCRSYCGWRIGFRRGGLYEHCLAEFGLGLTADTAMEQLVWSHAHAPEGSRAVAMEFVVANCGAIQVSLPQDGQAVLRACLLLVLVVVLLLLPGGVFVGEEGMLVYLITGAGAAAYDRGAVLALLTCDVLDCSERQGTR